MEKKTTVLVVLDGYGMSENTAGNAAKAARAPNLEGIFQKYPHVKGFASGLDVGLPEGQMGNSEVGHLNMGAGRIVYQELTRITKSIADGDFFENPVLLGVMTHCKEKKSALHIMGLLSDGGVHSHNSHLYALLRMAKAQGLSRVYVHVFLDGRDVSPTSGKGFIDSLEEQMRAIGVGQIASVTGRYYAMDRDGRWERIAQAYDALTLGDGKVIEDAAAYVAQSYERGTTDEFVLPANVHINGAPVGIVEPEDGMVFFNFRPDRARELTRVFVDLDFSGFSRKKTVTGIAYVCFTEYDKTIANKEVAFAQQRLDNTLGEYLSTLGKTQLRTAETEKYAHVTFFFNGGIEEPNPGESRVLVPSPKVATYDLKPEMSAYEVTEVLTKGIRSKEYDLIICNFANPDMVGHTGSLEAAVQAVEAVDACMGKVLKAVLETDAQMFVCADHGNCEQMVDAQTGEVFTAHTTNPVPFILVNDKEGATLRESGRLADIAPTLLELMGLPKPEEMTGTSLRVRK